MCFHLFVSPVKLVVIGAADNMLKVQIGIQPTPITNNYPLLQACSDKICTPEGQKKKKEPVLRALPVLLRHLLSFMQIVKPAVKEHITPLL